MSKPLNSYHILYLITVSEIGGAQKHVAELAKYFCKQFRTTTLMYGEQGKGKAFENLPVQVNKIQAPFLTRSISIFSNFYFLFFLYRFLRKNSVQVIHTHSSMSGFLGRLAARFAKVPFIFHTVHGYAFHEPGSFFKKWLYFHLEKLAARWTHTIICVNQEDTAITQEKFKVRAEYIPNGISEKTIHADQLENLKKALSIHEQSFSIGTVANFYATKGLIPFLSIFKTLVEQHSNIHWYLVGEGPLKKDFNQQIQKLGLKQNVHPLGFRSEIPEFLSLMDLFILPSIKEGLPLTLLEAMSQKTLCCVTPIGGMKEVIQDNVNGKIIDIKASNHHQAEQIWQALNLDAHEKRRLIEKAYQDYQNFFSLARMLEKTNQVYHMDRSF